MKLTNWELVGWNYTNNGSNRCITLTEEQTWAVFNALGIEMRDLPNDEYEINMYTDEALKHNRTCGKSSSIYNGKPLIKHRD